MLIGKYKIMITSNHISKETKIRYIRATLILREILTEEAIYNMPDDNVDKVPFQNYYILN